MKILVKLPLVLLTTLILFADAIPQATGGSKSRHSSESEFSELIAGYYSAWNSHDADNAGKYYAKDAALVFYDIAPLKYDGWAEYKEGVKKNFFDLITAGTLTPKNDLKVTRRGNVAWTTLTFHLSVTFKAGGGPLEADCRHTAIWEKLNGKWLIVHEHVSAPLPGN